MRPKATSWLRNTPRSRIPCLPICGLAVAAITRGLNVRIARKLAGIVIALCLLAVVVLGGMIAFGTAAAPPPLSSVYDAVKAMDFSGAPPGHSFRARDGADLAYRTYSGTTDRAIVLIHGSTGSSLSVHPLAKA